MVQHFALRWVLSRRGRMPWNYAKFLTAASDAGILKQSGGRYRFYHDKLREYLAGGIELKLEPKPISKISQTGQFLGWLHFSTIFRGFIASNCIEHFCV
jgi:hypothetical protein